LYGSGFSNPSSHVRFDMPPAVIAGETFGIPGNRSVRIADGTVGTPASDVAVDDGKVVRPGDTTGELRMLSRQRLSR
jgi:hypothetical protein